MVILSYIKNIPCRNLIFCQGYTLPESYFHQSNTLQKIGSFSK